MSKRVARKAYRYCRLAMLVSNIGSDVDVFLKGIINLSAYAYILEPAGDGDQRLDALLIYAVSSLHVLPTNKEAVIQPVYSRQSALYCYRLLKAVSKPIWWESPLRMIGAPQSFRTDFKNGLKELIMKSAKRRGLSVITSDAVGQPLDSSIRKVIKEMLNKQ